MIDDDLDRLLSDVESGADFSGSREESLRFKQRMARKSDINIETSGEGSHTEEGFIDRIKKLPVDNDILDYSKGVTQAVSTHTSRATHFRKILSEYDGPDSVHQLIQKYKYTFIRFLENIEKIYDEHAVPLSDNSLIKNARKDFTLFFEGFEDENKLDFLVLIELFLRLREFNSRVRKEWNELSKSIGVINLATEGKELYSELNAQAEAALAFCIVTDKFLNRIADFLSIPAEHHDVSERDIFNKTIYRQSMSYKYDALFNPGAYLPGSSDLEAEGDSSILTDTTRQKERAPLTPQKTESREDMLSHARSVTSVNTSVQKANDDEISGLFTVRGTNTWNTREPYLLKISRDTLSKDYDDLASSFYYSSEPENNTVQESAIKRTMIRFLSDTSKNIEAEYGEFIFKTIITQTQELCDFFDFRDESRNLFIYHLGPVTLYRALVSLFQHDRIGLCFKYLPGNRVVRYIPSEYLKEKILNWHEANINTLEIDFDKIQYFDEIRRTVLMKYNTELANNGRQLEEMILKLKLDQNPQFNKQEFFKSKWNQWFGTARIAVYNRFIEKSIFK